MKKYLQLIRFSSPAGTLLLLWPPLWVLAMLTGGLPDAYLLVAFIIGAFLMRSAGCIINDLTDRKLDARVTRTQSRPLASGAVSVRQAFALLAGLLLAALVLVLTLGMQTFLYALLALPLIIAYPWMKRITYWPQLFLGITFNYGVILASVALAGIIHPGVLAIYAGSIFWTLGYDTIYGFQDIEDDVQVGIKSTARLFASQPRLALCIIYSLAMACWLLALMQLHMPAYAAYGLVVVAAHFIWQISRLDTQNPTRCKTLFISNAWLGGLMFLWLIVLPYPPN